MCLQNTYIPAMISNGTHLRIWAQLTYSDTQFELCIWALQQVGSRNGTKMLPIRRVDEQPMALNSRLPEQKPLAIRGPGDALSIERIWIPRPEHLSINRIMEAQDIPAARARQQCQMARFRTNS